MKKNFYIKLLEYGVKNTKGFNLNDIINDKKLSLTGEEKKVVERYIKAAFENLSQNFPGGAAHQETPFLCVNESSGYAADNLKYTLTFDANFKYVDYLELKQARETAKIALITASIAIILSFSQLITKFL